MPHHRARFTARGRWQSFVVSSRMARRSPRRPPGRTSRSRRCGSGSAAGGTRQPAERASLACLEERSSRPQRSPAPGARRGGGADLRAARRTGWSPRRLADEPEVAPAALDGASGPAARRLLAPAGPERPAVVRYQWPCPGQLLHMDTKSFGRFEAPGHAHHRRPQPALAARRLGVRALDRRRLQPARLLRDPRRRDRPRP